jgi:penicillin-binding protein 1A
MTPYIKISLVIFSLAAAFAFAIAAVLVGGYYYVAPSLPQAADLRDIKIQVPLQVYSRDGRLLAEFGEMKRTPVAYENIPPLVIKAVLAAEDEHFFEHPGVDYRGVLRGIVNELRPGGSTVGGSTITQQVTRTLNVFQRSGLSSGVQRFVQKFKEWILAFRIEREFTKQEILQLYLNTNFFGQRYYGVATAARAYFGKDLSELTVAEAALLAGIPNRPSDFNPVASPQRATVRRAYVLRRMLETGAIDEQQYQTALAEPVVVAQETSQTRVSAPYVAEMVRAEMIRRFGTAAYTAGLKVTTTIDSRLQLASNRAIHDTLMAYDERHGYRGPLAHVELPAPQSPDAAAGGAAAADADRLRALLEDYPTLLDYETAVVLQADDTTAKVFFSARGEQTIDFDALAWAAPFVTDDTVGAKPTTVAQVLHAGDIVRFRKQADGRWRLAQIPEVQGAFVSIDPFDGAIVALNGGFDFFLNNFNRATQARRQPGSSFKPFVYSAGLDHGFTPATVVNDSPPDVGYQPELERVWKPENFGGKYHGDTRLRVALKESMNAVSIRLLQKIGVPTAVEHAHRFGFDDAAVPNNLSLALGAGNVAPVDLVGGYAAFANGGYRVTPYFIDRVTMASGEVLYTAHPAICPDCNTPPPTETPAEPAEPALVDDITELYPAQHAAPRVISPQNAYLMTDMLRDVISSPGGTGAAARRELKRGDLSGKTGTTNEGRDTWFVGFNADVVAAAWVGFDQFRPLGGNEQGGFTAIPMWIDFMRAALTGKPEHELPRPPGIVEYRINPTTGLIASDGAPNSIFEKFDIDNLPEREPDSVFSSPFNALEPTAPARSGEPIF